MENDLDKLLKRQHLIIVFIKEKLELVNYIFDGYTNNDRSILRSRFLMFTAHVYYRSIVVDMCALFADKNKDGNGFWKIYTHEQMKVHLMPGVPELVKEMVESHAAEVPVIKRLRDKEYAHYDFLDDPGITFSFEVLPSLNNMFDTATKILFMCGTERVNEAEASRYILFPNDHLDSLKLLLKK